MAPVRALDSLLQKTGTISYELYLCHMPMLLLAATLSRAFALPIAEQIIAIIFALICAFMLADETQKHISQRTRKMGLRLSHSITAA